ncbi:MAG: lasso peptide biosynthesis B2 protein [Gemmatimonadaceae bacterium]|nr:lasso peptide biosynthesis B2 protein [Gemmatimonadaceae bacterium]
MSERLPVRWSVRLALLIAIVPPLLHVVPVDKLATWLGRSRGKREAPPISALVARVDYWLRRLPWPWRSTCLKRAAVLYGLLRPAGEDVQLHIGVRRLPGKEFQAHAWLMRDGAPFVEPAGTGFDTFQMITAFPEMHEGTPSVHTECPS